ncbi:MAG: hypothetical protein ACLUKN_12720 [Bacilli bacterium]
MGAALGVGFVGAKAVDQSGAIGAFGKIMVMGILGMALAEAIAFYSFSWASNRENARYYCNG